MIVTLLALFACTTGFAQVVSDDLAGPLKAIAAGVSVSSVEAAAANRFAVVKNGRVQVEVYYRSSGVAAGLEEFGGTTEFRFGARVQGWVPTTRLNELANHAEVSQVKLPDKPLVLQGYGASASEGVQLTAATAMHSNGIQGAGVKIAIIDSGFAGYDTAQIPVGTVGRTVSFRTDGTMGTSQHGTAVAEIVADMAPAAEIYLIATDTEMSIEQAVTYVRTGGFDIASMSLGILGGPYDGSHPLSQKVNAAAAAGVLWINSAGNHALKHYEGNWRDSNGNKFHEWSVGKENMLLNLTAGPFVAYLSWYETAGATTNHDFDLVLVDASGAEVARSAVTQNGDDAPAETLLAYVPTDGQYSLRIERMSPLSISVADRFQLFLPEVDVEASLQVPAHSIVIPAEASGAVAVGATRGSLLTPPTGLAVLPIDEVEPFSSRGPALSGILKPDLSGPDLVTTSLTGTAYNPFTGTSAAAPHVAGAAALLMSEDSSRDADVVLALLKNHAVKSMLPTDVSGNSIPDNVYGYGRIRLRVGLDSRPPEISISFPRNGQTITDTTPTLIANITDVGSGVDESTIQVKLNGTLVTGWVFNSSTGLLTYAVTSPLTRSAHSFVVDAKDYDANAATSAVASFRIAAPSIDAGIHLISLPFTDIAGVDPVDVFGIPYNELELVRWVPADSQSVKYHVYPDDYATFSPPDAMGANPTVPQSPVGLGYFIRLPQRSTLSLDALGTVNSSDTYDIQLKYGTDEPRGWNMIGNPFDGVVDWGTVSLIADGQRYDLREAMSDEIGLTEGVLFDFISTPTGGYYQFSADATQDTMEFMRGYWVHVLRDCTLTVYNPTVSTSGARVQTSSSRQTNDDSGWRLPLSAVAGAYQDPCNYIGVHPEASNSYDLGLDICEPPAVTDGVQLYMVDDHANSGHLVQDLRNATATDLKWSIEVATAGLNNGVTISWGDINTIVPRGVSLFLRDVDAGREIYMRTSNAYTFQTTEAREVRHLEITATFDRGSALAVQGVSTSEIADGGVTIAYTLSKAANVRAEIRNIAGVPIAQIGQVDAAGGVVQSMTWSGRNTSGAKAPAGRYLVQLTACTDEGQTVQTIALFNKTR